MDFIFNISEKTWSFSQGTLENFCVDINIGFINNENSVVDLNGVSFGYSVKLDGKIISEDYLPKENVFYISTDQNFVEVFRVENLFPDNEYVFTIWAKKDSDMWEQSVSVTLPIPEQPYPSWHYDKKTAMWNPPVPHPNDGGLHEWDESTTQWIELEIPKH